MLVFVTLLADLGDRFGRYHQFDLDTPSEVFCALAANFADFRRYLIQSEVNGVSYYAMSVEDVPMSIIVAPGVTGESGVGKILAGVAVLAIGAFMPFSIGLLGAGVLTSTTIGAGLILNGAGELLNARTNDGGRNKTTNTIGTLDTVGQGDTIAIAYGRVFIRGRAISAGTTTNLV